MARGRPRKYPKPVIDMSCPESPTGFHVTVYEKQKDGDAEGYCKYCTRYHLAKDPNIPWGDGFTLKKDEELYV